MSEPKVFRYYADGLVPAKVVDELKPVLVEMSRALDGSQAVDHSFDVGTQAVTDPSTGESSRLLRVLIEGQLPADAIEWMTARVEAVNRELDEVPTAYHSFQVTNIGDNEANESVAWRNSLQEGAYLAKKEREALKSGGRA